MLYLTRKEGEKLLIGDKIVIEVSAIHKGHVRIGVDAPRDIEVHRPEFLEDDASGNK